MWIALASGPVVLSMLLAKWASAAAVLVLIVLGAGTALMLLRARGWWRFLGAALLSVAVSVGLLHLFVHPVDEIVDQMLEVSRLLTVSSNSPPRSWSTTCRPRSTSCRPAGLLRSWRCSSSPSSS